MISAAFSKSKCVCSGMYSSIKSLIRLLIATCSWMSIYRNYIFKQGSKEKREKMQKVCL